MSNEDAAQAIDEIRQRLEVVNRLLQELLDRQDQDAPELQGAALHVRAYPSEEDEFLLGYDDMPMEEASDGRDDEAVLRSLASKHDISPAVEQMIVMRNSRFSRSRPRYWGVVDFARHSAERRLYVFDVVEEKVKTYLCAHGVGSEGHDDDGIAEKFDNTRGSKCTSLGIYRCAETYTGSNGYSMRLDGLEDTNSNARRRFIVMHGAHYVSKSYARDNKRIGRSEGCPALDHKYSTRVIDQLKFGSFLNHWTS